MNLLETPPADVNAVCPDDLDGLLRAYFRAALPAPWPDVPAVSTTQRHSLPRSRLALAASVLVLVGGHFLLADRFSDAPPVLDSSPGRVHATRVNAEGQAKKARPTTTRDAATRTTVGTGRR